MKRTLFVVAIIVCVVVVVTGGNVSSLPKMLPAKEEKKACVGYTVIEHGKGVDCNGDTLTLVKRHGFYEVVQVSKRADDNRSEWN